MNSDLKDPEQQVRNRLASPGPANRAYLQYQRSLTQRGTFLQDEQSDEEIDLLLREQQEDEASNLIQRSLTIK